MTLTPESYKTECGCGREHTVLLETAVIEPGALYKLDEMRAVLGLGGTAAAVYDENTYAATEGRRPKAGREIVLPPQGLHADEHGVELVQDALAGWAPEVLIAVGAGTVHDITRYCAAKLGVPFISAPTAASVDGFVSTVAAMTWRGFKKTMPGVSPRLLVADVDILKAAPWRLTCSGVGDILGKYTSLADWRLGEVLTGEYYCEGIAGLTKDAVDEVLQSWQRLALGNEEAYTCLMKALVLSGVAMQLAGNSRPASGAEHHISHLIEMAPPWIAHSEALHGEKVGVGTLLAAREYRRWSTVAADALNLGRLAGYQTPGAMELEAVFGPRLAPEVAEENTADCLCAVEPAVLAQRWERVRGVLASVPDPAELEAVFAAMGAPRKLEDIGVSADAEAELLRWSPYVRNRLTFMRVLHGVAG